MIGSGSVVSPDGLHSSRNALRSIVELLKWANL